MKRNPKEIVDTLLRYHKGVYDPTTSFLQELTLVHSVKMPTSGGGEFPLNNSNTKRLVGLSDFQGEQVPPDANGLIRAIVIRYGDKTCVVAGSIGKDPDALDGSTHTTPAIIDYLETRACFPPWLLQSELVLRSSSQEAFRVRIAEFVPSAAPDRVPSEWAKELEKTIKIEGNQTMQLYLNTPEGAYDPSASKDEYVQVVLYGVKFAARKNN